MSKEKQVAVVCAAVKIGDTVIPCVRHWDEGCHVLAEKVFGSAKLSELLAAHQEVQGFLNSKGQFMDRYEASELFNSYSKEKAQKMLFSEDLY